MSEPINLKRHGPVKIGNLPESDEGIADLSFSVVYIFFRCYKGGKTLVYVGKAGNFANRLVQHYGDFFSTLVGTLYYDDGSVFRPGGRAEYFKSLQGIHLDETIRRAIADARRTRFVYTYTRLAYQQLAEVEATIIRRIQRNLSQEVFELWNTTCRTKLVGDFLIQHDHSQLAADLMTKEEADRLHMILSACQTT